MVALMRPNDLGERSLAASCASPVLVAGRGDARELQRTLYACAKRSPERRFHALFDRVCRSDVLREAWKRVKGNRGAAGVDRVTLVEIEAYGVERMLGELQGALRAGSYRYYLHRWPSQRSMKRVRQKIKAKTGRDRVGIRDIRELIAVLNPILRGWGNYFRTGNAAERFVQLDRYVAWRLKRLLIKRKGRNLRAGRPLLGRPTGYALMAFIG